MIVNTLLVANKVLEKMLTTGSVRRKGYTTNFDRNGKGLYLRRISEVRANWDTVNIQDL